MTVSRLNPICYEMLKSVAVNLNKSSISSRDFSWQIVQLISNTLQSKEKISITHQRILEATENQCFLFWFKRRWFSTNLVLTEYFWKLFSQATKLGVAFYIFPNNYMTPDSRIIHPRISCGLSSWRNGCCCCCCFCCWCCVVIMLLLSFYHNLSKESTKTSSLQTTENLKAYTTK